VCPPRAGYPSIGDTIDTFDRGMLFVSCKSRRLDGNRRIRLIGRSLLALLINHLCLCCWWVLGNFWLARQPEHWT
jgi:hypothetical protein